MDNLHEQLTEIDTTDINASFAKIARSLMCDHVIQKGNNKYAIVEIEFYLYTDTHRDVVTYPRDTQTGQWFFHQSGVDLTFKSETPLQFGGILIRAIKPLNSDNSKIIWGPQKCVEKLWDVFDAFSADTSAYPHIVAEHSDLNPADLCRSKRWIDIKTEKRSDKIIEWAKRIGLDTSLVPANYKESVLDNVKAEKITSADYMYRFFCLPEDYLKVLKTSQYSAKPRYIETLAENNE